MSIFARWRMAFVCALLAIGGGLYYIFDPAHSRLAPKCSFKMLTGWDCPGCGSQRMLHSLLHLDLASAWEANPFLLCMIPPVILIGIASLWRTRFPKLYSKVNSPVTIAVIGVAIVGWTILRNIL